ncbi:hypothetical protein N7468_003749 [Penicillium chermesinum]|uniref:AAA+ ATPase domain-containing protein n=1 Tax=Penicillium chermesinum TaxID=63820 RepID=A0A9W9P7I8_9EURO|nr:uncharacterized protein N7468_003749 [Penicillium chermesinum]KAJ5239130.1 hypothetical protein N7468_003749 [Penicillium chermesinum]
MDTVVSPPQGMGHGEPQTIHPFFQQGTRAMIWGAWSAKLTGGITASQAMGGLPRSVPSNEPANVLTAPNPNSSNHTHLPEQPTSLASKPRRSSSPAPEAMEIQPPSPKSPEEDLNSSRRKRRKTEKSKKADRDAPLRAGLSEWLGKEIAPPRPSADTPVVPTATKISDIELPATSTLPGPEEPQQGQPITTSNQVPSAEPTIPAAQSDKERKTLRLNSNGRLLSSPPVAIARPRCIDQCNPQGRENTYSTTPAPPARPANIEQKPAKPTHPFFAKKPSKPQDIMSERSDDTAQDLPEQNTHSEPVAKKVIKPLVTTFPSSRPRKPKFQELLHPLWPTRDLFHVSGIEPCRQLRGDGAMPSTQDYKKSKLAAVSVTDEENALLRSTALARKIGGFYSSSESAPSLLRHPTRSTASGRTIKEAVLAQLATSTVADASRVPVISKLAAVLPEKYSAFDSGKHEHQLWAHKYAPQTAEDVLQMGREAYILRDWLEHLKVTSVDTGKASTGINGQRPRKDKKKKKKQKQKDGLDDFIVSSEEEASEMDNISGSEDELAGDVTVSSHRTVIRPGDRGLSSQHDGEKPRITNAILLSGPSGSGKTASVYAVAKELDYEVFEINPGSRRSARDMLERVGDMTQNHLVHLLNDNGEVSVKTKDSGVVDDSKQNKLVSFFKGPPTKAPQTPQMDTKPGGEPPLTKRSREQKQSLILLEEADILFEEDKQFWTGVLTLISQSRRPIIITCNDESRLPTQDMSLHAILRYQRPPPELAVDYLLLVAACEGHLLKRSALAKLYNGTGFDIRRALADLNFWCQMAVGSTKSGLDWFLPLWPPSSNVDQNGERVRVLSLNTYEAYMGWLNRDLFLQDEPLEAETEALRNTYHWWRLGIQEIEEASGHTDASMMPPEHYASKSKMEQLDMLSREADYSEMRSSLDILCSRCPLGSSKDVLDTSLPPMPTAHRSNYIDAYPLLQTDLAPEYSGLSESIGLTFDTLLSRTFRSPTEDVELDSINRIFKGWSQLAFSRQVYPSAKAGFQKVFEPIMRVRYTATPGRLAPSFESSLSPITEDLAPYIRSIMVFDGRLKEYRDRLYAVWAQDQGGGDKRARTTRASRAALEGSDKAFTRRERWFPDDTNYFLVQGTGMPEWQHALFQMGHFHIQPAAPTPNEEAEMPVVPV